MRKIEYVTLEGATTAIGDLWRSRNHRVPDDIALEFHNAKESFGRQKRNARKAGEIPEDGPNTKQAFTYDEFVKIVTIGAEVLAHTADERLSERVCFDLY